MMSLSNITFSHLNFTQNCSNLALGINVWVNDFEYDNQTPGNFSNDTDTYVDGPNNDFPGFWTNGASPEWLSFWRATLASVLPSSSMNLTDEEISNWSNSTEYFDFFDLGLPLLDLDNPDTNVFSSELSNLLAYVGGCNDQSYLSTNIASLGDMGMACITDYCCSSITNSSVTRDPKMGFPYYANWTVEETCSFNTCQQSNNGNPDLGGIGILVAYLIEASILALSIVTYTIRFLTDRIKPKRPKDQSEDSNKDKKNFLESHDDAVLKSSGIFLDTSVFFAMSVCFAAVIFNYRGQPLLYEDKLGQASTLLTIDAPVAILLLSYWGLERPTLRIFVTVVAAILTFIIQFMFRRARSFNPKDNLCLDWDKFLEQVWRARFTVKAVWASLVFAFCIWKIIPWHILQKPKNFIKWEFKIHPRFQFWKKLPLWAKVSSWSQSVWTSKKRLDWESLVAYGLAVFALYDSFYDIRFFMFLRRQEREISVTGDQEENKWGYGQILALFVWVPVIVEYTYVLGLNLGSYRAMWKYLSRAKDEKPIIPHEYQMLERSEMNGKGHDRGT